MPCNKPYTVYKSRDRKTKRGKPAIEFKKSNGIPGTESQIACGQCWGCRLEHSRIWAIRNLHEAKLHPIGTNHFVTLTYNDEHLPSNNNLHPPHLTKFWKRLRKHGYKIRYYACGEYGDTTQRPHYHALIYNLNLPDKSHHSNLNGNKLYTSQTLERLWGHGHTIIGNVTFESCAYVSRYIMKKWKGKTQHETDAYYERTDNKTGLIYNLKPEYQVMSRNPGIGKLFYQKYKSDMFQPGTDGQILVRGGIACKTPQFYENLYQNESEQQYQHLETIKETRRNHIAENADDNTPARRRIKESILSRKITNQLPRPTI